MQRISEKELNIIGERFDSLDEIIRITKSRELNAAYKDRGDYSAKDTEDVKSGIRYSHDQSMEDLAYGTEMFNEEFAEVSKDVKLDLNKYLSTVERSKIKKDVVGGSYSIGRVLAGQPNPFNRRVKSTQKVKTVNLYYSLSCPYGYSARDRIKGGCVLMAMTEALEKLGYQVAITLLPTFSFNDGKPSVCAEVALKDYKTRFNAKKVQFALASKTVLFHLGKWWMHRSPEVTYCLGGGEGMAVDNDTRRLENAKKYVHKRGGVYLSHVQMKNLGYSVKRAMDFVLEQVE